ncbi:hypothetical protein [Streptomyces sp. LS1784]|uniref:hypothetical protein n=1 Tax=Streptomyces sp. LS1784 TaxID=2851533 RepID=UPI001CCEC72D|nr:hypothetical protein [Streptomyces sp. LS1784]
MTISNASVFKHAGSTPQLTGPETPFAGPGWRQPRSGTWVYQDAPGAAHVQAVLLDDGNWFLDLWSAQSRLLACGSAPADEVAALAPALTANAARWAPPSGLDASRRRFTATAEAVRAHARPVPDEARVRAATSSSPARPQALPAGTPATSSAASTPTRRRR